MVSVLELAKDSATCSQTRLIDALTSRIEKMAAYFGRQCGVDADDLRQEAWLAVLEMMPHLDMSVGSPEQHLLKRARWPILDTIRWQRRRQHTALAAPQPNTLPYLTPPSTIHLPHLQSPLPI